MADAAIWGAGATMVALMGGAGVGARGGAGAPDIVVQDAAKSASKHAP